MIRGWIGPAEEENVMPKTPSKPPTKAEIVVRLLARKNGASVDEIAEKTGWKRPSVRAFISTLQSKQGVSIEKMGEHGKTRFHAAQ